MNEPKNDKTSELNEACGCREQRIFSFDCVSVQRLFGWTVVVLMVTKTVIEKPCAAGQIQMNSL